MNTFCIHYLFFVVMEHTRIKNVYTPRVFIYNTVYNLYTTYVLYIILYTQQGVDPGHRVLRSITPFPVGSTFEIRYQHARNF